MRILASERRMYEIPQGSYQNPKKKGMGGGGSLNQNVLVGSLPTLPLTNAPPALQSARVTVAIIAYFQVLSR